MQGRLLAHDTRHTTQGRSDQTPCSSNRAHSRHVKCIAAPPTANTAVAAAGIAQTTGGPAGARAACSNDTATVISARAPAWCAEPSSAGTYVNSVAMPRVTCTPQRLLLTARYAALTAHVGRLILRRNLAPYEADQTSSTLLKKYTRHKPVSGVLKQATSVSAQCRCSMAGWSGAG